MSYLRGFPKLPTNVGPEHIPNFIKFKVVGPVKTKPVAAEFNFTIKDSPLFGTGQGSQFDEGKLWHPIRAVEFGHDEHGLKSFRAQYAHRTTRLRGTHPSGKTVFALEDKEHIIGISGSTSEYGIVDLTIHTSKRKTHVVKGSGGNAFEFHVPRDHSVVSFHGTDTGDRVTGLGVSYQRTLDSVRDTSKPTGTPTPVLTANAPTIWLDAVTQAAWAKNDMATVEAVRTSAANDLLPIYTNIEQNGNAAWTQVESEDGELFYLSWTSNAVIWAYVDGQNAAKTGDTSDVNISIGSYSSSANFLGISTYTWSNLPSVDYTPEMALGFVYIMRPVVQVGVELGASAAAAYLIEGFQSGGLTKLAKMVPESVVAGGGLIVAGLLGIALILGCIALASIIFRQYFLIVNVYNFSPDHTWKTVQHYEDNSEISNGAWEDATIPTFQSKGPMIAPPDFQPVKGLKGAVSFYNVNLQNISTVFSGLGEAIVFGREDLQAAVAVKYVVHRVSDNAMGVEGIAGDGKGYDLSNFYNDGTWVSAKTASATAGGVTVSGYSPLLSGAKDFTYTFEVSIGLPPPF